MTGLKLKNYSAVAVFLASGVFVACSDDELPMASGETTDTPASGTGGAGGAMTGSSTGANGGTTAPPPDGSGAQVPNMPDTPAEPRECAGSGTGDAPIIDDFDDKDVLDKFVPANEGRNGWWEAFDDEEGTFEGKIDFSTGEGEGVDGSNARCVALDGHTGWGAVIAVSMGFPRCMYDASNYAGICFEAKGEISQGEHVEFSVNTADTLGSEDGGRCDAPDCERFWHYKTLMRDEDATAEEGETLLSPGEYRTFCYTWDELQQDAETPSPFDKNVEEVVQFEWKWPGDETTPTDGTLCLDNVRFMEGQSGMGGSTQ